MAQPVIEYFAQYQRINMDFTRNGGESFPMACFYETVGSSGFGILAPQEFATIEADWVENRPLNASHRDLNKYAREDDQNYARTIAAIRNLHDEVLGLNDSSAPALRLSVVSDEPSVAITGNAEPGITPGLRVLALDGGGIRGLFGIIVLQSIMEEVRKIDCPESDDPLKPCDYFDLIGGTSTGGLLGIMLGRLRMDLVSCKEAYKSLSESIFRRAWWTFPGKGVIDALRGAPWYSGNALEAAVKRILSERISQQERDELNRRGHSPSEARMRGFGHSSTKTFVCAIIDKSDICERLRTYDTRRNGSAALCTIWQACRATSAAPLYFPSIEINDRTYWDGGMNSNNPILQVIQEVRSEHGEDTPFEAIVSIGTGKSPKLDPGSHVFSVIKYAIKEMTNTEKKHEEFVSSYLDLEDQYFRFNEDGNLYRIDLADWKQLPRVEEIANNYITSARGRREILACAKKLAKRRGDTTGS
ncbi:MAG: hypothetical protein M1839_000476 [Geoglossum umbratile]|nr:MAG: hypothetical protein M1839_000476 [Geoglossum umbratile]